MKNLLNPNFRRVGKSEEISSLTFLSLSTTLSSHAFLAINNIQKVDPSSARMINLVYFFHSGNSDYRNNRSNKYDFGGLFQVKRSKE